VDVVEPIGSAESYLGYIVNRPGEKVPGSVGKVAPFVEAKIVDPEGNEEIRPLCGRSSRSSSGENRENVEFESRIHSRKTQKS
jgi:long-subunit acyl-CoA synthetase (AMP-forming)